MTSSAYPPGDDDPIRVALVGYGVAGRVFHAPLVAANSNYRLDAVVTASPQRAEAVRQRYPATRVLSDPSEIWSHADDFDLVVIASPNSTHLYLGLEAISAGLPLVVDKPLAPSLAQAEEFARAAEVAKIPLAVFLNRRWDGDYLTIKQLITEGSLGEVFQFESRFSWWEPALVTGWKTQTAPRDGGGALFDLGPHLIDQAIHLFGPVRDFYAELDTRVHGGANDDDSFLSLVHENGVRSRLWMSRATALRGPRFRVLGSQGGYAKTGMDPQEQQSGSGMEPGHPKFGVEGRANWGILGTDDAQYSVPTMRGAYSEYYVQLRSAVVDGGPLPVSAKETFASLRIIEQAHARYGRR
jgi:predicted dehydrogenase